MDLFTYETYQDVRKNLFFYSVPSLVVAGFFCYWGILPAAHQHFIWSVFSYVSNSEGVKALSGGVSGIVVFSLGFVGELEVRQMITSVIARLGFHRVRLYFEDDKCVSFNSR
jgi:hypothetical protein